MGAVKQLLIIIALSLLMGGPFGWALANDIYIQDPPIYGRTSIPPPRTKPRSIVRFVCYWDDSKLTCVPAIGTKVFKEKK